MKTNLQNYQRLSRIITGQEIQPLNAAHSPGGQCPLFGTMAVLPYIKDAKALIVGPTVCTYNIKLALGIRPLSFSNIADNMMVFPLHQDDVVFGFEDKLRNAIVKIDTDFQPAAIFIVSTCVPEITGEDLDAAAQNMASRVNARLIVIHTDHFTETDMTVGIERALAALAELMEPKAVEPDCINVLGCNNGNIGNTEFSRLLADKGVKIKRAIPSSATVSDIASATDVSLNLVLEHRALALAIKMEEEFKTPFCYQPRSYSLEGIERWYYQIACALHIDIDSEVSRLKSDTQAKLSDFSSRLKQKRFCLRGVTGGPFAVARFLVDLGMEPVFIHASRFLPQDEDNIQTILDAGYDPLVVNGEDSVEIDRLLEELRPDFYIPYNYRDLFPAVEMGIHVRSIESAASKLGFECSLETARLLAATDDDFGFLHGKVRRLKSDYRNHSGY